MFCDYTPALQFKPPLISAMYIKIEMIVVEGVQCGCYIQPFMPTSGM